MTVDVVVLGPDGKPVSGLTRDDFVVKEDGRQQAIAAFEAVEALVPGLESPETVRSSPSLARVATNVAGPPTRRTFAIVFDDMHVGDLDLEQAKSAVGAFVERQARPGDRLVLFTTSDARFWATTRGAEDRAFAEALRRIRSHQRRSDPFSGFPMTHYEALRIEEANDDAVMGLVSRRLGVCGSSAPPTGVPPPRRRRARPSPRSGTASRRRRSTRSSGDGWPAP